MAFEFNHKDITELKEFVCQGTRLVQVEYNENSGRYLYERYYKNSPSLGNRLMGYEIVKPVKRKNHDGSVVYISVILQIRTIWVVFASKYQ